MKLYGTRDCSQQVGLKSALLSPSSNFGGLFSPLELPKFNKDFFKESKNFSYNKLAMKIIESFNFDVASDIFEEALKRYEKFDKNYDSEFSTNCPVFINKLGDNLFINELFHGPTRAFKDMALQPFGYILDNLAKQDDKNYLIICATSGDTGPATLETFANCNRIKVVCLYPKDGTSEIQKLQMVTNNASNVKVFGIDGNFDDTQRILKSLLNEDDFKNNLKSQNLSLSAANSVNFGRILFQIIYHFYTYIHLLKNDEIKNGDKIDIVVPSGNFGNALGAYYAKKMGVKINKIKIASNANNILTDFFNTGVYDLNQRELIKTISPAMDILVSSNIERLIFDKIGDKKTKKLFEKLKNNKKFKIDKAILKDFKAKFCTDKDCIKIIDKFAKENILIDPHTATCFKFCNKKLKRPTIITSTAHWAKFTPSMIKAIKHKECKKEKEEMIKLAEEFKTTIPNELITLFDKDVMHLKNLQPNDIKKEILDWIKQ